MRTKKKYKARSPQDYRILFQDTGDPLTRIFGPLDSEKLIETSIGPLRDYPIDAYCHCVNHTGGVYHNSKVREKVTEYIPRLRSGSALQMRQAINQLIAEGTDPLAVYAEGAHAAKMDYFLRLRMNDLHDRVGYKMNIKKPSPLLRTGVPEPYYYPSQFKLKHPEYLLGDPDDLSRIGSKKFWEAGALNYALSQVREYNLKLAKELVENYDLDGLELDFIRHPFLFAEEEAYAQRHLITEMVRRIRKYANETAKERNRPILLSARVPDSIEMSLLIGLDIQTWLREGLLDLVTIGGGYCPFGTPWREIVSLAQRYSVPALATLNKVHELGLEAIRAAAERAYAHGVQGFLLWNFFYEMEYYHQPGSSHLGFDFIYELVKPDSLKNLARTYCLDESTESGSTGWVLIGQAHARWPGQIPLTIGQAADGIGNQVVFDAADVLVNSKVTLCLKILNLGPEDEINFFWNHEQIQKNPRVWVGIVAYDLHQFQFDLSPELVYRGENRLEIQLTKRDPNLEPYVTLLSGKLVIEPMAGS